MKPSIVYNCHVTCCDWSQQVTWYQQQGRYSDLSSAVSERTQWAPDHGSARS
ncbi:unnamed protein product [Staurois parvus]|uniref:Uncharacterized protein n=1 Tax=Staurois parvus TaxID=386267 RepID=A0ABN9E920_9NEOB|nr:unnamed protein product [Staurois parvus]